MMTFPTEWKKKVHVPNHQLDNDWMISGYPHDLGNLQLDENHGLLRKWRIFPRAEKLSESFSQNTTNIR